MRKSPPAVIHMFCFFFLSLSLSTAGSTAGSSAGAAMNTLASLGTLQGLGTSVGLNLGALTSSVSGKNVLLSTSVANTSSSMRHRAILITREQKDWTGKLTLF